MHFNVIIIGAGAAGMMCAAVAGQRGRRVLLIDHAKQIGERIRISGGGRCNFTNKDVGPENFLSQNPRFCRSALAQFSQRDFIKLVTRHGIRFHEKSLGQLFCDDSAQDIIRLLKSECDKGGVTWAQPCDVKHIASRHQGTVRFSVQTTQGAFDSESLVIATGGLAAPALGASPLGYQVAAQFGLPVVPPRPALVPLALAPQDLHTFKPLAGISFDTIASCEGNPATFRGQTLITHRGLSGPAILQISSYWQMQGYGNVRKQPISLNVLPHQDVAAWLAQYRRSSMPLASLLAEVLPHRFAQGWCVLNAANRPLSELSNKSIEKVVERIQNWQLMPAGTLGFVKAEVTLGGVDSRALSSKTMEARDVPGLYFVGEVVDVTGWLGGYNFQWAWSSGWVAGQDV